MNMTLFCSYDETKYLTNVRGVFSPPQFHPIYRCRAPCDLPVDVVAGQLVSCALSMHGIHNALGISLMRIYATELPFLYSRQRH